MKYYKRRFARQVIERMQELRTETMDALLWEVDVANHRALCKVQGSDTLVSAHFPRNWTTIPFWLKRGSAVRLAFRGGNRGFIELTGPGRAIPTPVAGGTGVQPTPETLPDQIISGFSVTPTDPESMAVVVSAGTYRIGGVVYGWYPPEGDYLVMGGTPLVTMGIGTYIMGDGFFKVDINAAPSAGYFRYDLLQIGVDGILDYVAGTSSQTAPVKPTVSTDHVVVTYILVRGASTSIVVGDIGSDFVTKQPSVLNLTIATGDQFEWNGGNNYPETNVTVEIDDQYGQDYRSADAYGFTIELALVGGTGQVWSGKDGYGDVVSQNCNGAYTFKYQRNQTITEENPVVLQATVAVSGGGMLQAVGVTMLLDSGGQIIVPS